MPETKPLKITQNGLARSLFGITKQEAIERGICIDCKKPAAARIHSELGKKEYFISGYCEVCFDSLFGEN